ncbi:MAG: TIM barrel protein, partial [Pseudolabrys sp.]
MNTDGLSINLATVRQQWNLREAVEACARHGIRAVDPWRDQVAVLGLDESVKVIKGNGMRVTGYCRGGMFPAADAAGRLAVIDDNKRAIDEAAALGAECLVLVAGGLPKDSRDIGAARQMVMEGLLMILPHAKACGVPLAIEPLHPMYA